MRTTDELLDLVQRGGAAGVVARDELKQYLSDMYAAHTQLADKAVRLEQALKVAELERNQAVATVEQLRKRVCNCGKL